MNDFEIKYGIGNRKLLIIIPVIAIFIILFSQLADYVMAINEGYCLPSSVQYHLGKILYGTRKSFGFMTQRKRDLPIEWLTIQIGFSMTIMGFAYDEITGKVQSLIRYESISKWWNRRIRWIAFVAIIYYTVLGCILIGTVFIEKIICVPLTADTIESSYDDFSFKAYIITSLLFILRSYLVGLVQLIIEIKISPLIGICVSIGLAVAGVLLEIGLLPAQLAMLSKNSWIIEDNKMMILVLVLYGIGILFLVCFGRKSCKNGF
ncbi:MAG: hypothetical protein HUJ71_08055 [Pseudobutyrivibrio sp.]|nr:hypothetical protein [Pseudobutyrivibrio sp.]